MIVSQAGDISFWSLEGQKTKKFNDQGTNETVDITCLGFDESGEKFYVAGSDGKIRVRDDLRIFHQKMKFIFCK